MSDPHRPVCPVVSLVNARLHPPTPGQRVLALQRGGALVPVVWSSASARDFVAWMHYPKIPQDVKDILLEQYQL